MKKIFLSIMVLLAITGCRGNTMSGQDAKLEVKVKSAHQVNLEIGPKVTGQASSVQFLGLFHYFKDAQFYEGVAKEDPGILTNFFDFDIIRPTKAAAAFKALQAGNADLLVSPTYIVEVQDFLFWKNVNVTAHAYAATIKGFEPIRSSGVRY